MPAKQENVIVAKIGHHVQTDYAIIAAWEMCVLHGVKPHYHLQKTYQLHAALMLSYLGRIEEGGVEYFDARHCETTVRQMEKEWLTFDYKVATK